MAKITTGSSFGLNIPETTVCRMYAAGKTVDEILYYHYGIDGASTPSAKAKARKALRKLMEKPGFEECFRAIVRQETQGLYAQSIKQLGEQVAMSATDPKRGWLVNKAANDIINKYHDTVMGVNSNEVLVKVEGMPTLGKPEDAESPDSE
jgi:hypothetical protein